MKISEDPDLLWTSLGVRLQRVRQQSGACNWLFLPGGSGLGSESLTELVDVAEVPGACWLVDLPGSGSNVPAPGAPEDPYVLWPHVLVEAVDAVPNPVLVAHSNGGEQALSVPVLEGRIAALVIISSAPDAGHRATFDAMVQADPSPEYAAAAERYDADPSEATLRQLSVAAAPWSFPPHRVSVGREFLERLPYNPAAAEWSAEHFERRYVASWWPESLTTLIVSGAMDRIVDQTLWDDPYYRGEHVQRVVVDDAGHWPWLDQPAAVGRAMSSLVARIGDLSLSRP